MTDEEVEVIARKLFELDQQKGLRRSRWHASSETVREEYRQRARTLLANGGTASAVAKPEE